MEIDYENSVHGKKAMDLFKQGYNCSQSVFLAFSDMYDMDEKMAAQISSSFGGGMGRLREVCGAVSGMFMVAGVLFGYDAPEDAQAKKEHYARIQKLAGEFTEENGSIVCRELLGNMAGEKSPVPEQRTAEYYKKRPCVQLVGIAAALMEKYISEHYNL